MKKRHIAFTVAILLFGSSAGSAQAEDTSNDITTVYLVRHTEKALEVKQDPPLTKIGEQRAHYWANVLQDVELAAIYSTDTARTRNTAKPIADANKKEVSVYTPMSLTREALMSQHAGQNILIVGHSNTVPALSNRLIEREKFDDLNEEDYSNLFIVSLSKTRSSAQKLTIELPSN